MTMIDHGMLAVGKIPLHPGVRDYADTEGKVVLWVKDEDEGRSLYMSIEMYGEIARTYEVQYDDWLNVITKMAADVAVNDANDPFNVLLGGSND